MTAKLMLTMTGLIVIAAFFSRSGDDTKGLIAPGEAQKLLDSDSTVIVLDVRTPEEFNGDTGHLAKAILLPLQELEQRVGELTPYKEGKIVVYCRSGHRSTTAAKFLEKKGFNVLNLDGGILRWKAEDLPVVKETR